MVKRLALLVLGVLVLLANMCLLAQQHLTQHVLLVQLLYVLLANIKHLAHQHQTECAPLALLAPFLQPVE